MEGRCDRSTLGGLKSYLHCFGGLLIITILLWAQNSILIINTPILWAFGSKLVFSELGCGLSM